MMGVFSTAIVQSSSATTSIVVAMAASGLITLKEGIPVIMGTNVGTSLTSTMVSLSNIQKLEEYELGFSVAVVHDLFNWLTILFMLPLEIGTGLLEYISGQIVKNISFNKNGRQSEINFSVKALFEPLIRYIVLFEDKELVNSLRLINNTVTSDINEEDALEDNMEDDEIQDNIMESRESKDDSEEVNNLPFTILKTNCPGGCTYLLSGSSLSDEEKGAILLAVSLLVFLVCYILIIKAMKSLLSRPLAGAATQFLSKYISSVPCCMGYVFMII